MSGHVRRRRGARTSDRHPPSEDFNPSPSRTVMSAGGPESRRRTLEGSAPSGPPGRPRGPLRTGHMRVVGHASPGRRKTTSIEAGGSKERVAEAERAKGRGPRSCRPTARCEAPRQRRISVGGTGGSARGGGSAASATAPFRILLRRRCAAILRRERDRDRRRRGQDRCRPWRARAGRARTRPRRRPVAGTRRSWRTNSVAPAARRMAAVPQATTRRLPSRMPAAMRGHGHQHCDRRAGGLRRRLLDHG